MILSVPPSFSTRQGANWVLTAIQVDRQIRLLDQSIEEAETVIALASHPDSQPRRILSYSVTGRWLRPQIESPPQPSDNKPGIHEPPTGKERREKMCMASVCCNNQKLRRPEVSSTNPTPTSLGIVIATTCPMAQWCNVKIPQNAHAIGFIMIVLGSRRHRKGNGFVRLADRK